MRRELQEGVERALTTGTSTPTLERARDRVSAALTDLVTNEAIVQMGSEVYADTAFLNASRGLLPGFALESMGFGEFYLSGPGGAEIQFDRMRGKPFPGQSGRSHKVYDNQNGELVRQLLDAARAAGLAEHVIEVVVNKPEPEARTPAASVNSAPPAAEKAAAAVPKGLTRKNAKDKGTGKPQAGPERKKRTPSTPSPKGGNPGRKGGLSHSRTEKGQAKGKTRPEKKVARKPGAGRSGMKDKKELPGTSGK
jgi:hypothetical protein